MFVKRGLILNPMLSWRCPSRTNKAMLVGPALRVCAPVSWTFRGAGA